MSDYTPGPWKAYPVHYTMRKLPVTDWCVRAENGEGIRPTEANARLVAAAPEMYNLLQKVFCWMADEGLNEPLRLHIDEVLNKAEGCERG